MSDLLSSIVAGALAGVAATLVVMRLRSVPVAPAPAPEIVEPAKAPEPPAAAAAAAAPEPAAAVPQTLTTILTSLNTILSPLADDLGHPNLLRRYRGHPAPLVRDLAAGWRSGRLSAVLGGDFDLIGAIKGGQPAA